MELRNVYPVEFYSLNLYIVFRCLIVSVRYAFVSKLRLQCLHGFKQLEEYLSVDLFAISWIIMDPVSVDREIESGLWRN